MPWPPGPVWVILPTYNERPNLQHLVSLVRSTLEICAQEHAVLIVDDCSPDGTGEIADRLSAADPHVQVLHRERKSGLGQAYLAGFRHALAEGAALVIEMDADFSHDPMSLPDLIAATKEADVVLGSRYVPGGGVVGWGLTRQLVSRGGCWYARTMLSIDPRDLTGGFKCFRREVLLALELDDVQSDGYAFQVELTYRALQSGFSVKEVPILFAERRWGKSKMSWRIVAEALWMVPSLRLSSKLGSRSTRNPARGEVGFRSGQRPAGLPRRRSPRLRF